MREQLAHTPQLLKGHPTQSYQSDSWALYLSLLQKKMYVHHGKGHPGSQRGPLATSLISSSRSILINSTNWARVYLQEQAATSRYSVAA